MRVLFFAIGSCLALLFRSNQKFDEVERDFIVKAGLMGVASLGDTQDLGTFIQENGKPTLKRPSVSNFLKDLLLDDPRLIFEGEGSVSLLLVYATVMNVSVRPLDGVSRWSAEFIKVSVPLLEGPSFEEVSRYVLDPERKILPRLLYNSDVAEDEFISKVVNPYMESMAKYDDTPFMAIPLIYAMVNGKPLSQPVNPHRVWQVLEICQFPMQKMVDYRVHFQQLIDYFNEKPWNLNLISYAWSFAMDSEHWIRLIPIFSLYVPRYIPGADPITTIRNLLRDGLNVISTEVVGLGSCPRYPSIQVVALTNLLKRHPSHCRILSEELMMTMLSLWSRLPHEQKISLPSLNRLMTRLKTVMDPVLMRALYLGIIETCMSTHQLVDTLTEAVSALPSNSPALSETRKAFLSLFFFLPFSVLLVDPLGMEGLFRAWLFHPSLKQLLSSIDGKHYLVPLRRLFSNLCAKPEALLKSLEARRVSLEFVTLLGVEYVADALSDIDFGLRCGIVEMLPLEMQDGLREVYLARQVRRLELS